MKKFFDLKKKRNLLAGISFFVILLIGILTIFVKKGILGEERIYYLFGLSERNSFFLAVSKIMAFIGSPKFLVPAIFIFAIYAIYISRRDLFVGLVLSTLFVFILNTILKNIFRRPRPLEFMLAVENSYSFPSGHAMTNTAFYLFLAYYFSLYINGRNKKRYYMIAIIASSIMGASRVYLGVHYISDVVAGILGGYLGYVLTAEAIEYMRYITGNKTRPKKSN